MKVSTVVAKGYEENDHKAKQNRITSGRNDDEEKWKMRV